VTGANKIPRPSASWDEIIKFAHTFDGYEHWGSFERCADVANSAAEMFEQGEPIPDDADVIRTCLFFEARRWRHSGWEPEDEDRPYIAALLNALREASDGAEHVDQR